MSEKTGSEHAADVSQGRAKLHLAYLDGLRAVAMLWVLLNHSYNRAFSSGHGPVMGNTPHWLLVPLRVLTLGHYAVDLFICLSGFCLALPVVLSGGILKGGAIQLYWRRARRILPPYYISMVFVSLVFAVMAHFGGEPVRPVTTWGIITHLVLIQDLFRQTTNQINGVLWSVAVEWRIYFLLPLILYAWRKIGSPAATAIMVVLSYVLFRLMQHTSLDVLEPSGVGSCPHYIGLFALGMLGAALAFGTEPSLLRLRKIATSPRTVLFLSLLAAAMTAVSWYTGHKPILSAIYHVVAPLERRDFVVGLWAACLMAAAGKNPQHWSFQPLSSRALVFFGTFAYSTYLTHEPILTLVKQAALLFPAVLPFQLFLIEATGGIAAALGVSYLFHLAFERPFMSKPGTRAPKTEHQAEAAAIINPAP